MLKEYTFRDWLREHKGQTFIWVHRPYKDIGRWWDVHVDGWVGEFIYYWKCRLFKRWHVLKCPHLPPTYMDRCDSFIDFMFQMLVDEVEKDGWFNGREYFWEGQQEWERWDFRDEWQEVALLYDWWVNVRPQRERARDQALQDWHEELTRLGGFQFRQAPGEPLSKMISPEDRGLDTSTERTLLETYEGMEKTAEREDELMMHRLVAMVPYLWV
jgi:hypothetical protein